MNSETAMDTMTAKMTKNFEDNSAFTSKLQTAMQTNNVASISPDSISADTTAKPKKIIEKPDGSSNDVSNNPTKKDPMSTGGIAALVIVLLLLIAAAVGAFFWHQSNTKASSGGIELFERKNSINSINPLSEHQEVIGMNEIELTIINAAESDTESDRNTTSSIVYIDNKMKPRKNISKMTTGLMIVATLSMLFSTTES